MSRNCLQVLNIFRSRTKSTDVEAAEPLTNTSNGQQNINLKEQGIKTRHDPYYLQFVVQSLICYDKKTEKDDGVQHIRRAILLSTVDKLDEFDEGGERKGDLTEVRRNKNEEKAKQFEKDETEPMCVLERILLTFLYMEYEDVQENDVIELILVKSKINYRDYKEGKVLLLLEKYSLIKFFQWQILNNEGEDFIKLLEDSSSNKLEFTETVVQQHVDLPINNLPGGSSMDQDLTSTNTVIPENASVIVRDETQDEVVNRADESQPIIEDQEVTSTDTVIPENDSVIVKDETQDEVVNRADKSQAINEEQVHSNESNEDFNSENLESSEITTAACVQPPLNSFSNLNNTEQCCTPNDTANLENGYGTSAENMLQEAITDTGCESGTTNCADHSNNETNENKIDTLKGHMIRNTKNLDELLEVVFVSGSLVVLEYLMDQIQKETLQDKLECPLHINAVFWSIYVKEENIDKFHECFACILNSKDTNINTVEKRYHDTALHLAGDIKDDYLIQKILEKNPSIAIRNKAGLFPIANISYKNFKGFLDSMILDLPRRFIPDGTVWKVINGIYLDEFNLRDVIFMDLSAFYGDPGKFCKSEFNDLELLEEIFSSNHLWTLANHPVISTILELHWMKFKQYIFFDQFPAFFIVIAAFILLLVECCRSPNNIELIRWIEILVAIFGGLTLIFDFLKNHKWFSNVISFLYKKTSNIMKKDSNPNQQESNECTDQYESKNVENRKKVLPFYTVLYSTFIKIPLLVLIIIYVATKNDEDMSKTVIGIGMILLSINITLLIGYFVRSVAHCVVMVVCVAVTAAKFIGFIFLILVGFAISLLLTVDEFRFKTLDEHQNKTSNVSKWSAFGLGFLKTGIMSTGEFDAGNFQYISFWGYIIFTAFIFTIPIVFMNLLNALAIEDVQKVKREAMIWYRRAQLMVLYEFELQMIKLKDNCTWFSKYKLNTNIYPDLVGTDMFLGIRTTTAEVFAMKEIEMTENEKLNHIPIGFLSWDTIRNTIKLLFKHEPDNND